MTDVSTTRASKSSGTPPERLHEIHGEWDFPSDEMLRTVSYLYERVDDLDVNRTDLLLALELVSLESECSSRVRFSLFCTALASIVSRKRGSVRLDFSESTDGDSFANRLERYLPGLVSLANAGELELLSTDQESSEFEWKEVAKLARDRLHHPEELSVAGRKGDSTPLIVEDHQLYHQRSHAEESRLSEYVSQRLITETPDSIPVDRPFSRDQLADGLEQIQSRSSFELTPTQNYAVLTALCTPLSVVTGGPGTGKTFIVIALLRLLNELNVSPDDIAIGAPTGKAANRLGETIKEVLDPDDHPADRTIAENLMYPSTLHRLLGYSEKREDFYYHRHRPLPYRYVVIDEASMIDLTLMEQLFSATAEGSSLCLLGDADQLPAVESGAVFRDLVPNLINTNVPWRDLAVSPYESESHAEEPLSRQSVRLKKNFRVSTGGAEAENLLSVSDEIKRGGEGLVFVKPTEGSEGQVGIRIRKSIDSLSFSGVEQLEPRSRTSRRDEAPHRFSASEFEDILRYWYDRWYGKDPKDAGDGATSTVGTVYSFRDGAPHGCRETLDEIFRRYNRAQLLSITRRRRLGSREVNRFLHRYHRKKFERSGSDDSRAFEPGEPVLMNRNDYDRNVFNGDRGIVLNVRQERIGSVTPMAVFPGVRDYRAFSLGPLRSRLSHAFSLTVHKSQGSEFGTVGIILPGRNVPLLTRELLYTGVTRAREAVTFFGSRDILKLGASDRDDRNSGLLEKLRE